MRFLTTLADVRPALGLELGVQLALGQVAAHHTLQATDVAIDFLIAHAVYGRDRLVDGRVSRATGILSITTALATGIVVAWLSERTPEAVPAVCFLATMYRGSKPLIGPIKPLIVGAAWGYALTELPYGTGDPALFGFYALLYAGASNLLDIKDAADDARDGIRTPASRWTMSQVCGLSTIAFGCALAVHTLAASLTEADMFADGLVWLSLVGSAYNSTVSSFDGEKAIDL